MAIKVNGNEVEASGVNVGAVDTAKGVEELTEDKGVFVYNKDIVTVFKEVTKSNLYVGIEGVDCSGNLEELTNIVGKFSDIAETLKDNVSVVLTIKTLLEGGIAEYLIAGNIEERAVLFIMVGLGVKPETVVSYIKKDIPPEEAMYGLSKEQFDSIEASINEIIDTAKDSDGKLISNILPPVVENVEPVITEVTPEVTALNAATDETVAVLEEAMDEANTEKEELLEFVPVDTYPTGGGSSSSGMSTGTAIGIGLGVVALGAAAYFAYDCFFNDGADDDITLID